VFSHFDVIGVLLGIEDYETRYAISVIRVLCEWERNDARSQERHTMRGIVRHEYVKTQLATCRRGDLIIMYGNILANVRGASRGLGHDLQVGKIQRLIAGYAHHATGKCERGGGVTRMTPALLGIDPVKEQFDAADRDRYGAQPAGNPGNPAPGQPAQEVAQGGDRR
jgi:hypothetical protein